MICKDGWNEILTPIKTGEVITVSLAYRWDWKRNAYNRLVRRGLFTIKSGKGFTIYTRTDKPYTPELNPKVTYKKGSEIPN